MEIKEKESIKKEKIYELTEEELKQIIEMTYNISKCHLANYIGFCHENYIYEMNIFGICKFSSEVIGLLVNKKSIGNKDNLSYLDYRQKNFYCPWDLNNIDKVMKGELL